MSRTTRLLSILLTAVLMLSPVFGLSEDIGTGLYAAEDGLALAAYPEDGDLLLAEQEEILAELQELPIDEMGTFELGVDDALPVDSESIILELPGADAPVQSDDALTVVPEPSEDLPADTPEEAAPADAEILQAGEVAPTGDEPADPVVPAQVDDTTAVEPVEESPAAPVEAVDAETITPEGDTSNAPETPALDAAPAGENSDKSADAPADEDPLAPEGDPDSEAPEGDPDSEAAEGNPDSEAAKDDEALGEAGADDSNTAPIVDSEVSAIVMASPSLVLCAGTRHALDCGCALAEGSEGMVLPDLVFESSNPGIAAVDPESGEIDAVAPGAATVTARCGGQSASCLVIVKAAPEWIRFTRTRVYLREGERLDLRGLIELPEDSYDVLTYAAGEGCAVDADGIATGAGTVTATTCNGLSAELEIVDPVPIRTVKLLPAAETLLVGNTYPLTDILQIAPDDIGIDYGALDIEILDPEIAEPDGLGGIAAKTPGSTTIVVTLENGSTASGRLSVIDAETAAMLADMATLAGRFAASDSASAVSIDDPEIIAGLDSVRGREYEWTSLPVCPGFTLTYKDKALVKNRDYCVQYRNNVNPGTAGILITGLGTYTGTYAVTFRILPKPEVYLKPASLQLGIGEVYRLAAFGPGMRFTSSNRKVVAVNAAGAVKGLKKGKAVIRMTTSDGQVLSCSVTVRKKPTKVALSAKKLTIGVGQARALGVKLKPSGCRSGVTWSSSNTGVAVVENGTIIPLKPGKTTITARTYNGKKARCAVTVRSAPTSVALTAVANVNVKKSVKLKATVGPSGAMSANSFSSSDTSIATVNGAGKVTGKKPGTVTITVRTYNGLTATSQVRVWKAPTKVALNRKTATMAVGSTLQLTSTVSPADANPAVSWASSNKKIATVDRNGRVTAKKTGKVKIAVKTTSGKTAVCKITVKAKPKSIAVKAAKTALYIGESTTARAVLSKNSYSPIEWYVEGSAVTVNQSGRITAVEEGTATVYARATAAPGVIGKVRITVRSVVNVKGAIIDISKWQGSIDFKALKPAVSLVIARASCGTDVDSKIGTYAPAMNSQKIPFGVYCYSKAATAAAARLEARALYAYASKYNPRFYVMDAEEGAITQEAILAFVAELRSLGARKVGAYVGHHRYTQYGISAIKDKLDFVWIPRYGSNNGTIAGATKPAYPCDMWQYTSNGKVPGISGRVDMNVLTGQGKSLGWFVS